MSSNELRDREFYRKSRLSAYSILSLDLALYCGSLIIAVGSESAWVSFGASVANGVFIGLLFVVGHDCCHGSFLPSKTENYIVGQLAFLASLHPFSLWDLGHNKLHHRYTNLAEKDYVYRPVSFEVYSTYSNLQKIYYRFTRSFIGHFGYYLIEIWWKRMFFPKGRNIGGWRSENIRDQIVIVGWICVFSLLLYVLSSNASSAIVFGFLIPFLVWNWLMSFVIYLHHTNPNVKWYDDEDKWEFLAAQRNCTVHVVFPIFINFVFHRIMEHTAHHLRPSIPLYRLDRAQASLKGEVVLFNWSLSEHIKITKVCRVYDFENQRWLDYDGTRVT